MTLRIEDGVLVDVKDCEEYVTLPPTIRTIGKMAFLRCLNLVEVIIPDTVETIEEYAFNGCENLKRVFLPKSLTHLGHHTFYQCESLEYVDIPRGIEKLGTGTFQGCRKLISVTLPDSIKILGGRIFEGCENMRSVRLPREVEKIGFSAFAGCRELVRVDIPETVKSIEEDLFRDCEKLEYVRLPKGTVVIQKEVFRGCRSLKRVELPKTLSKIDGGVFYECESLTEVLQPDTIRLDYARRFFDDVTVDHIFRHQCIDLNLILDRDWRKLACLYQIHKVMAGEYDQKGRPEYLTGYPEYIKKHRKEFYPEQMKDMEVLEYFCQEEMIPGEEIPELIEMAAKEKKTHISARLLEYQNHLNLKDGEFGEQAGDLKPGSFDQEFADFLSLEL